MNYNISILWQLQNRMLHAEKLLQTGKEKRILKAE